MKVKTKQSEEKKFKPFTLEIEVETLEEARWFWHLFVVSDLKVFEDFLEESASSHVHPIAGISRQSIENLFQEIHSQINTFEL